LDIIEDLNVVYNNIFGNMVGKALGVSEGGDHFFNQFNLFRDGFAFLKNSG